MHRIALFLFLLPAWTWAQPELPSTSAQQLALGAYRTGFASLPDSTRAGKLYQRWHQHWAGRLDQNHSASTLLEAYQNPPPTTSQLNWTYAGPGVVDVQRQGRVECLATPESAATPQLLVAGTPSSGIWRSTDGGAHWHNTTDDDWSGAGLGCAWLAFAPSDPNRVYAAMTVSTTAEVSNVGIEHGYGLGIFTSTDAGETWTPTGLQFDPADRQLTTRILFHPTDPLRMYAAVNDRVLYTTDGWDSWETVFDHLTQSSPFRHKAITDLLADPDDFSTLWVCSNGVESWTHTSPPTTPDTYRYHAAEVWLGTQVDNTPNWTPVTEPLHPDGGYALLSSEAQASHIEMEMGPDGPILAYKLYGGEAHVWKQTLDGGWLLAATRTLDTVDAYFQFALQAHPTDGNQVFIGQRRVYALDLNDPAGDRIVYGPHVDTRFLQLLTTNQDTTYLLQGNDGGVASVSTWTADYDWTDLNGEGLAIQQLFGLALSQEAAPKVVTGSQDNSAFRNQGDTWDHYLSGDRYHPIMHKGGHGVFPVNPAGLTEFDDVHAGDYASPTADPSQPAYYHRPMDADTLGRTYAGYTDLWQWDGPGTPWTIKSTLPAGKLRALAVSVDGNVAVVAKAGPTWGGDAGKLWLTTNLQSAAPIWTDITPWVADAVGSMGVNALALHPHGARQLAVGFEQFDNGSPHRRVCLLELDEQFAVSTATWIGEGLPNVPVNTLDFVPGPGGALWMGNDFGVWRYQTGWTSMGGNLPPVFVSDLAFDVHNNRVWISTFGRGLWQAQLPCETGEPILLASDQTWSDAHLIDRPVVVPAGVTLTITGKAFFHAQAGLHIAPGGHLKVVGGCLAPACPGLPWPGIQALGTPGQPQHPSFQARVTIAAGSLICGAQCGVRAGDQDGLAGGAIVRVDDSQFQDCTRGVVLHQYRYTDAGFPEPQASRFTRNTFRWTAQYNFATPPAAHLFVDRTNQVYIAGCVFAHEGDLPAGTGLLSRNATWRAQTGCSQPLGPSSDCPGDLLPCRFEGLLRGVDARSWWDTETFVLTEAQFSNTRHSVRAVGVMLAEISDCVFDIDPLAPEDGLPAYGVHLLGCGGYRVAGNEFIGSDPSAHTAGVLVTASEDGPNRLFSNGFEELHWACLAQGDNRDDTPTTEDAWDVVADYDGLRVLCNTFSGNGYDFSVTLDGQVAAYQGTPNPEALWGILPAHNVRSEAPCSDANWLHINPGSTGYGYFYPETAADLIPTLDCYYNPEVYLLELQPELLTYDTFDYNEHCSTTWVPASTEVLLSEAAAAWNAWELGGEALGAMLDGGDTEEMLLTVNNPYTPPKSVRQLLTAQAPWTSHPVLRAAVARADLSDLELYSILNAHVPLHPTVYTQALEHWSQAPFWQAQLLAAQAGATPHACTQQQAQHAAWRNRALALEARALMHLKDAVQWNTWQAVTANFPRDPVRMRWLLAQLGKALNQSPDAQDYGVSDPFGAMLSAAGGASPDELAGTLGTEAGWRTVAAKPAVSMIVEPFAPAVPTAKSVVWSGAAPDALITYPNPSAGRWHLTNVNPGTWYVYTLQGALVGKGQLQGSGDVVDGTAWPSGTYLLQIRTEHEQVKGVLIRR